MNNPFKYGVKELNGATLLLSVERNRSTKKENSVIIYLRFIFNFSSSLTFSFSHSFSFCRHFGSMKSKHPGGHVALIKAV